jgi:tetratricopeptide (TPR) repeat protein
MRRNWTLVGLGVVLLATVVVYLPSIDGEFVLDDLVQVHDPFVATPLARGIGGWLSATRPLLVATYAINHATVGVDTRSWHITNVLVHLVAVALAWRFARRILSRAGLERPEGTALAVAALFALHPLQTESVAYIAQRAESLASVLYLAALLVLLVRDEATESARRNWLLAGAIALQLLGFLVKPIVATLPVAWLVISVLLPKTSGAASTTGAHFRRWLPVGIPMVALSAAATISAVGSVAGSLHAGYDIPGLAADSYLATQLRAIPFYMRLLVWPVGQCGDWYFRLSPGLFDPPAIAGGAFLVSVTSVAAWLALRSKGSAGDGPAVARLTAFGLLFFLVLLAPSSSVIPLRDPVAEHRVYLAALGLFLLAAAAATVLLRRFIPARAPLIGGTLAVLLLALAGAATAARNRVWTSALALYQDAVLTSAEKSRVHLNLGQALSEANRRGDALVSFRRARDLSADGTIDLETLNRNIVTTLLAIGRPDEAREEVAAQLVRTPDDSEALALLANVEFVSRRDAESERAALAALRFDGENLVALKYLGMARARRGDAQGAVGPLRQAAALNAVDPQILYELGGAEESIGNTMGACSAYARGAELPMSRIFSSRSSAAYSRLGCR